MTEIFIIGDPDPKEDDQLPIDFNSPEDVLIDIAASADADRTLPHWKFHSIESCTVINGAGNIIGAASYEQSYGGFLDYTIEGLIDCPGEGWFVVEGITGCYHKGDGWMTDDDMDFYCGKVRPATPEEIAQA